jgi:hypothetical protein
MGLPKGMASKVQAVFTGTDALEKPSVDPVTDFPLRQRSFRIVTGHTWVEFWTAFRAKIFFENQRLPYSQPTRFINSARTIGSMPLPSQARIHEKAAKSVLCRKKPAKWRAQFWC